MIYELLPRSTVLDKLRQDLGGSKATERCLALIDPTKSDSKVKRMIQMLCGVAPCWTSCDKT
jgi:hypothetical protein